MITGSRSGPAGDRCIPKTFWRGSRRSVTVVIFCVLAGSTLAACSATTSPATSPTTSPAGAQARWLIPAMADLPLGAAELRAHFAASFLAQLGPAAINQALQRIGEVTLVSSRVSQPGTPCIEQPPTPTPSPAGPGTPGTGDEAQGASPVPLPAGRCLAATVSTAGGPLQVTLEVGPSGLISGLRFVPIIPPVPTTWQEVDAAVRSVAPQVRLLVAKVTNGSCQPVHSIDPGTPAPLGSAFKLYVLDALARSIASGKVSWNQPLTVAAQLKSLPSGDLQNKPDGTKVSVLNAAAKMISISDNTAADMLINLVGRTAVEAALTTAGMADPFRDRPFLTTRELFTLKLDQWPALAQRYIAASQAGRRALLANLVDRAPLPAATAPAAWRTPRDINSIEWFASANDICHVYASLAALARRPGLSPVADVLEIFEGSLGLDPAQWQATWFKGGSEPGVLTYTYMATTRTGHSYVVAVLAENPSAPTDKATAMPAVLSAVKGAFTLAARG
jgi:beta-lactamase class A